MPHCEVSGVLKPHSPEPPTPLSQTEQPFTCPQTNFLNKGKKMALPLDISESPSFLEEAVTSECLAPTGHALRIPLPLTWLPPPWGGGPDADQGSGDQKPLPPDQHQNSSPEPSAFSARPPRPCPETNAVSKRRPANCVPPKAGAIGTVEEAATYPNPRQPLGAPFKNTSRQDHSG